LHGIIKSAQRAELRSKPTGNQIRAKIVANREKRLTIAEAMKNACGLKPVLEEASRLVSWPPRIIQRKNRAI
jgi:hypothetical protein